MKIAKLYYQGSIRGHLGKLLPPGLMVPIPMPEDASRTSHLFYETPRRPGRIAPVMFADKVEGGTFINSAFIKVTDAPGEPNPEAVGFDDIDGPVFEHPERVENPPRCVEVCLESAADFLAPLVDESDPTLIGDLIDLCDKSPNVYKRIVTPTRQSAKIRRAAVENLAIATLWQIQERRDWIENGDKKRWRGWRRRLEELQTLGRMEESTTPDAPEKRCQRLGLLEQLTKYFLSVRVLAKMRRLLPYHEKPS